MGKLTFALASAFLFPLLSGGAAFAESEPAREAGSLGPGEGRAEIAQPGPEDPASVSGGGQLFDRLDTDEDGSLDEEELAHYGVSEVGTDAPTGEPDRVDRLLERFDRNKDGVVSRDEFEQASMTDREDVMPGAREGAAQRRM